jgi:hypothetical protein
MTHGIQQTMLDEPEAMTETTAPPAKVSAAKREDPPPSMPPAKKRASVPASKEPKAKAPKASKDEKQAEKPKAPKAKKPRKQRTPEERAAALHARADKVVADANKRRGKTLTRLMTRVYAILTKVKRLVPQDASEESLGFRREERERLTEKAMDTFPDAKE